MRSVQIAAFVAVVSALAWWWMHRGRETPAASLPPAAAVRAAIRLPDGTKLARGRAPSIGLSPDGRRLVYVGESAGTVQLYLRDLESSDSVAIDGTEGAMNPFFSPNGEWVGFFVGDKLKKVPTGGGGAVILADAPAPRGSAWGNDDEILLVPRDNTGVWRTTSRGGRLEPVTTLADGEVSHRWPQVLPNGKAVLFTIWSSAWDRSKIAVQPLDGRQRRVILTGGGIARFISGASADAGHLAYVAADGIHVVPFDVSRLAVTGPAVRLAGAVIRNMSGGAEVAVSQSGSIAYVAESRDSDSVERELVWVDRNGRASPAAKLRSTSLSYGLSPDGSHVARYKADVRTGDVWSEDLAKGTSVRVSFHSDPVDTGTYPPTDRLNAVWSPDGRQIAHAAGHPTTNLFLASADGGRQERLTTSGHSQWPTAWSRDGRTIAFVDDDPLSGLDIWLLTLDGPPTLPRARPFLRTPFHEAAAVISPDGHWIAYHSNESGRYEVYVQPFPDGGQRWQISTETGIFPRWSPRGDELFFRAGLTRGGLTSLSVTTQPAFRPGESRILFDASGYDGIFEVAPNGRLFLMMRARPTEAAPTEIHVIAHGIGGVAHDGR